MGEEPCYDDVRSLMALELEVGTCHQPLHGFNHEPLLLWSPAPPEMGREAQGGTQE